MTTDLPLFSTAVGGETTMAITTVIPPAATTIDAVTEITTERETTTAMTTEVPSVQATTKVVSTDSGSKTTADGDNSATSTFPTTTSDNGVLSAAPSAPTLPGGSLLLCTFALSLY